MMDLGKYTIQEVETRTEVPAGTLRQWERRYGVPQPERSESGFRLFSDRDIARIEVMKRYIGDGVPAARAAEFAKHDHSAELSPARSTETLRQALVVAFLQIDEAKASQVLSEAHALHPLSKVLTEVMQESVVVLGGLWHAGKLDIATEHFASNFIQAKLRSLLVSGAQVEKGPKVIVACAPLEQHELGPLTLAVLLRRSGCNVVYLGANTPLKDLREMAQKVKPVAILISATTSQALEQLIENKDHLRNIAPHLVFGGLAFKDKLDSAELLGGHLLAGSVEQNVQQLETLLRATGDS